MTSNFFTDWTELNPTWKNYLGEPFSEEIHVVRINIPKNIPYVLGQKKLLEESELQKLSRIIRQEDKNIFLTSQVMKKIICGQYLKYPPEEVSFAYTENNKPFVSDKADFHFNISHSGNWLVLIFSRNPCGVDVEKIQPDFNFDGVMKLTYHPDEIGYVQWSPDQHKAFFRIWAIKESFLKATGVGLIDNLSDLNMMKNSTLLENPNPWKIQSFIIDGGYWCSICFKSQNPKINFYEY
jgi:4'-phosphopantetheinyl transferase